MRYRYLSLFTLVFLSCSHLRLPLCLPEAEPQVRFRQEPRALVFTLEVPEDGCRYWIEYGESVDLMGIMSEEKPPGKKDIVLRNIRPGHPVYWRLCRRALCGVFKWPRHEIRLPSVALPPRA